MVLMGRGGAQGVTVVLMVERAVGGKAAVVDLSEEGGGKVEPSKLRKESGIDKSLALERKIESRKRNFSLDLENLIVPISLSTLDFREWQETILFLLSIFESGKNKFSFHSRFSRVARQISLSTLVFFSIFESSNREFNIIYSRWFKIDQPISVPEV